MDQNVWKFDRATKEAWELHDKWQVPIIIYPHDRNNEWWCVVCFGDGNTYIPQGGMKLGV